MKYSALKEEIESIGTIAKSLPEEFQLRCFEVMLNALLQESSGNLGHAARSASSGTPEGGESRGELKGSGDKKDRTDDARREVPMTAALRVFMGRQEITADQLQKILFVEDSQVHWIREPVHKTLATGQIEWALLLALRGAILDNQMLVDPEAVRSICQEKGFYDGANFASHFKKEKASSLFKGAMAPQGSPQGLTTAGEKSLGDLIRALAGASS